MQIQLQCLCHCSSVPRIVVIAFVFVCKLSFAVLLIISASGSSGQTEFVAYRKPTIVKRGQLTGGGRKCLLPACNACERR
jgi:hypothetical protein